MAFIDRSTRVGRSQGVSIFWGLVSVCFAAAACYYFWKNSENETTARVMRDEVSQLREENDTLNSKKDQLQASQIETANELKTREELVQEKETELAAEEARLEGPGQQSQTASEENEAQVAMVKKFNDLIRKLGKSSPPDVVERGGRPVLRVPNSELFAPGDVTLKPEGKTLLNQIAQGLNGEMDHFELRVVSYSDSATEAAPGSSKPVYATSWDLTAARASAMARFFRDETSLPFLNVLVIGRGDSEPISLNGGENHARNRRVEITVTPLPTPFHSPDPDKDKSAGH
ncbi:MAG TPA: OmpA family protein [Candidatus Methylacidiphilales bacterium]|nr:OmpA family protein [Candidatus Methylacidiphilales bacterium]